MSTSTLVSLQCTTNALAAAAQLGTEFGIDVSELAALIDKVHESALAGPPTSPAFLAVAADLLPIMTDLCSVMGRLHDLACPDYRTDKPHYGDSLVSTEMLASVIGNDKIGWLRDISDTLSGIVNTGWQAFARPEVVDPRAPLIVAVMATAAQFWFDFADEFPNGEFVVIDGSLTPEPGTGLDFITSVVLAANPSVEMEELQANVEGMQRAIGMSLYLDDLRAEEEERAARRAKFRVVK